MFRRSRRIRHCNADQQRVSHLVEIIQGQRKTVVEHGKVQAKIFVLGNLPFQVGIADLVGQCSQAEIIQHAALESVCNQGASGIKTLVARIANGSADFKQIDKTKVVHHKLLFVQVPTQAH